MPESTLRAKIAEIIMKAIPFITTALLLPALGWVWTSDREIRAHEIRVEKLETLTSSAQAEEARVTGMEKDIDWIKAMVAEMHADVRELHDAQVRSQK